MILLTILSVFRFFLLLLSHTIDSIENKVLETEGKRYTVTSQLRIKPGSDDDYMEYTCQAKHKALSPDKPMQATVQLSVLCK